MEFKSENLQKHKELKESIKDNLEVADSNSIKEKEQRKAYYENLPEGMTKKQVEELSKYNAKYITSSHLAVGELAADIFNKHKDINTVEAELGFFGPQDSINIHVDRTKTYQNHLSKDGNTEITKHLVMTTTINSSSIKGIGLKAARESMAEEFANSFKK